LGNPDLTKPSLLLNFIIYPQNRIAFALYATGIWVPTLTGIALLFGIGNAFDSIVSLGTYVFLLQKQKIKITSIP
jgi:hypothetical protein